MSLGSSVNALFRKGILTAASSPLVQGVVDRYGMQLGASRFVAGSTLEEGLAVLHDLERAGFKTNTALLGEGVDDEMVAAQVVDEYIDLLNRLDAEGLGTIISLKLSHLGLDIGEDTAYRNVTRIVEHAAQFGRFVRIDMEESWRVDTTLLIYRNLRQSGHDNVGTVLQSYLYRSMRDLKTFIEFQPNLRIVKGAYLESQEVAFPSKRDVDVNYLKLAKYSLAHGGYTAIATHDERIIEHLIEYTTRNDIGTERFEFQMLYGIESRLQQSLLDRGYTVLVSTPFGPDWYPYLMRRLAERPANLLFVAKNLFPS
ncbi:MAG: proline dehydrogenase family protein [Chloroflexota bacterium]